jgi:hypothetical protein
MGQAKKRGTKEERIAQSIARKEAEDSERRRKVAEWWQSLSPEEQEAQINKMKINKKRRLNAATLWSSLAALGMM